MDVEGAGVPLTPLLGDDVQQVDVLTLVLVISSLASHGAPNDGDDDLLRSDPTAFWRRFREL